ncbi:MAG: hypothetical protein EZS28_049490, partial [Streblomastix strix]
MNSLEKVVNAGKILMEFLSYFHGHDLVHCNFQPSSFLLHYDHRTNCVIPKVCHLSESQPVGQLKKAKGLIRTHEFHPPEVIQMKGGYDYGIDIYGLGLSLYLLGSGKFSYLFHDEEEKMR